MLKLFKYLRQGGAAIPLIIALLIVQAYCDLALPQYTANIVDIGIQQGGIANVAPTEIREETLDNIKALLNDEQSEAVTAAYEKNKSGSYSLVNTESESVDALDAIMAAPMAQLAAGAPMGDMNPSIIYKRAMILTKAEYAALGVDMGALQTNYLLNTGGKMLGLSLLMLATAISVGLLAARTAAKIGMTLRGKVFKRVLSFSSAEMDTFSTASLITRSTNDIQQVQMVAVILLRMVIYAPILAIGGVMKVTGTQTGMGWIIGVAVCAIFVLVGSLLSVAMPKFKIMQTLVDKLNLISREILTGIPVIRAFSREKHEESRFETASRDLMKTQLFTSRVMTLMMPCMMLIMNSVTLLIVWVGAGAISTGTIGIGDMMAFISYTMQIVMSFLMLTMISVMLPRAGVSANRIEEVISTPSTITDIDSPRDEELLNHKGVLSFDKVSFSYPNAGENTLESISFTALPGETTAIIGSTGCGKSTLVNLIPRFYDVTSGRITIDGVDIREITQSKLRSLIGLVPQKGVLFSGSIESNLKFGGESITDEAMENAARIAQAKDFIDQKEEGYNAPVSQGGTNVSGGQRQRLSIARAIAQKPQILLFDDCFSALDYKTDVALRRALSHEVKESTVIIVAQRISTILHADRIIVLEDGKVVGDGNHTQLMESCEPYREIANSQLSESELKGGRPE